MQPSKQHRLLCAKAVLKYCLLTLLALSFFSQSFALVNNYGGKNLLYTHGAVLSSAGAFNNPHFPFPFKAESLAEEPEVLDEMGADDDSDFEFAALLQYLLSTYKFDSVTGQNLFAQLTQSIQNRPTVSLFVLHHSWKSFLI